VNILPNNDIERNKIVARRLIRAFDDENFEVMGDLLSPDFRYHQNGKIEEGANGFRAMMKRVYAAWQPHRLVIDDEIAEGDRVVLRMTAYDTHSGIYRGVPATGAELKWSVMFIFRMAHGQIAEIWRAGDDLVRFEQVGLEVVPKVSGPRH
jgi:predicted ester cyclase